MTLLSLIPTLLPAGEGLAFLRGKLDYFFAYTEDYSQQIIENIEA